MGKVKVSVFVEQLFHLAALYPFGINLPISVPVGSREYASFFSSSTPFVWYFNLAITFLKILADNPGFLARLLAFLAYFLAGRKKTSIVSVPSA